MWHVSPSLVPMQHWEIKISVTTKYPTRDKFYQEARVGKSF